MRGITFDNLPPVSPPAYSRMDVACFIGFAPFHKKPLVSNTLKQWLKEYGWDEDRIEAVADDPDKLVNTPIPLESWDACQALFDDKRLDRQGKVRSQTISEPLTLKEADNRLYVIIDHCQQTVTLDPDENQHLLFEDLAGQINSQLQIKGAHAFIDTVSETMPESHYLVIQRTDEVTAGEITVFKNKSLGFPEAQQEDAVYIQNYLATAVNAFFRQGGKKCYVVCMGNPLPHTANNGEKVRQILRLIWGETAGDLVRNDKLSPHNLLNISFPAIPNGSCAIKNWQGLSHLVALPDVTYVCFPDLVDLLGTPGREVPKAPEEAEKAGVFAACSKTTQTFPWFYTNALRVPEYSETDYRIWKRFIDLILSFLRDNVPTAQLIASLPMPHNLVRKDLERFVTVELLSAESDNDTTYRRLQLVFPWLRTQQSDHLPDALEPPEGTLIGLLAGGALKRGAYRSIAGSLLEHAYDVVPIDIDAYSRIDESNVSFADRVCWFDSVPDGIALQSDVTSVYGQTYRHAVVRRIMIFVQRAAQHIGLNHVFEPSSYQVWRTIEDNLTDLLMNIYQNKGLRGNSSEEAFSVVCDRSTMTQSDIDNGRLIASITLQPAVPVEQIEVDLLLERDGNATLRGSLQ